jgi:hypothetical protein
MGRIEKTTVLVVVAIHAEQLPVAAVGGVIVMIMIAMMYGEFAHVGPRELATASPADPGVKLESLFTITLIAQFPLTLGFSDNAVEFILIRCFGGRHRIASSLIVPPSYFGRPGKTKRKKRRDLAAPLS